MYELNLLDKKIIYELENDSRQSLSKISRTLKTSQQVVSYRLKNLESEKYIKKHITIIDYNCLGYKNKLFGIKIKTVDKEQKNKLIFWLINHKNIYYVCETSGLFSFMFGYFYKKEEEILKIIHELKKEFYEIIKRYTFFSVFEMHFFNKDYFFEKYRNTNHEIIIDNKNNLKKIDDIDQKILKELSNNSKIATTEIAKKLKTTPEIIVNKIKKLNQMKIILGYRLFTNLENNICYYLIKLKNGNQKELINYLKNIKNSTIIFKTLGDYEIIVKFDICNKGNIYLKINEIKEKYFDVVEEIDVLFVNEEHKFNFYCY